MKTKKEVRTSWTMLALAAAALGLFLCACSGPAPEAAEGTVAATAPEATADTATEGASAAPQVDERPRPPDDADPLVIAEYYFEPEVWATVHRPPDRVPDEVLAALGSYLPLVYQRYCQESGKPDCRLRIINPPYGYFKIPFDALLTKKVEDFSSEDFEITTWGFLFSHHPQDTTGTMINVSRCEKEDCWKVGGRGGIGVSTHQFIPFEKKQGLENAPIQRRVLSGYSPWRANYLIIIPEGGTLEDGRFHFIDPMGELQKPETMRQWLREGYTPVDEPIGFREFVKHLKDEAVKQKQQGDKSKTDSLKKQPAPPEKEGGE